MTQTKALAAIESNRDIPKSDILVIGYVFGDEAIGWNMNGRNRQGVDGFVVSSNPAESTIGGWSLKELAAISDAYILGVISESVRGHN